MKYTTLLLLTLLSLYGEAQRFGQPIGSPSAPVIVRGQLIIDTTRTSSDTFFLTTSSNGTITKRSSLYENGTGILKLTGTTPSYIVDNSANWTTAYNRGDFRTYGLTQANPLTDYNLATAFTFNNNTNPAASNVPAAGYHSVISMGNNTGLTSLGGQIALRYGSNGGSFITADLYTRSKSGSSTWNVWNKYWHDGNWFSTISADDYFDDGGTAKTTSVNRVGDVLYGVLDGKTKRPVTYRKITKTPNNENVVNSWVDGVMIRKKGTEFFIMSFDSSKIDLSLFGVVGDVKTVERTAGANFGLAYKADGTLATDNSTAFKKAVDFIHNYSAFLLDKYGSTLIGYHGLKFKFTLPVGAFLVTEPEIFSKSRTLFTGYSEAGFIIEGQGKNNSQIVFRNDGDTLKYLINNSDIWQSFEMKNLSITGVTGKERLYHESSNGLAGMSTFTNVGMREFYRNVVVDGTSLNADRMLFDRCQITSSVVGNIFFLQNSNTQAIKHTFRDCSITIYDGTMFENNASGDHLVSGCSLNAYGATTIFRINPTGTELGEQVVIGFSCYTNKIELHDQSMYADLKGGYVHVYSEDLAMDNSTATYFAIIRNRLAGIRFDKCVLKKFPIALINPDANSPSIYDDRPFAELMNCTLVKNNWIDSNIHYFSDNAMTLVMDGTDTSAANIGRVRVFNSITKTGGLLVNAFNDGAPFSWLGNTTRTTESVRAIVRDTKYSFRGLPTASVTDTFNVPLNTLLLKIAISKTGNAQVSAPSVLKWYVKDLDGTVYATLTTAASSDIITVNSGDLFKPLKTNNSRRFILSADAANGNFYAQGFVTIEYQ